MAKGVLGDGTSSDWVDSYDQYVTLKEFLKPPFHCMGMLMGQFQHGNPSPGLIDVGCHSSNLPHVGPVKTRI